MRTASKILKGEIWDPVSAASDPFSVVTWPKGAVAVDAKGKILAVGSATDLLKEYESSEIHDFGDQLILPGFVDTHLHFPQLDIIGSHGEDLLGWLDRYTLPVESRFADKSTAERTAGRLITELLANGTTTGVMFSSSHAQATEILFSEAWSRGYRAIIGKVSMDRNGPENLLQTLQVDLLAQEALLTKWHRKGERLYYAVTPRFAPSCSEGLMRALGKLKENYPDIYVQTHFAESEREIEWVRELFPKHADYLSIYEGFNLIGDRTLLAHGIHVTDDEWRRLVDKRAVVVHCPTSNSFLGSGLFSMRKAKGFGARLALGSDIGAGTSLSIWQTMAEAYKVQRLQGYDVKPEELFHMATLGAANALSLGSQIGSLSVGKAADIQVLDWRRCRLLSERMDQSRSLHDRLFALITLADDRLVHRVFVDGKQIYSQ